MSGPAPKATGRRRANVPARGEWKPAPAIGWQHGDAPACPARGAGAQETWAAWFRAWFAAHWDPSDLPNLRLLIGLWARVSNGSATREQHTLYVRLSDDLGITRKGQQDRRWQPPEPVSEGDAPHLRVVGSRGA